MEPNKFDKELQALAGEVDRRAPLVVEEAPVTADKQRLYWIVGLVGALILGGLEVGVLMIGTEPDPPPPPAIAPGAFNDNPCTQRLGVIMIAIARYASDKGAPPAHLSDLGTDYLSVPPVDPVSGQPYTYTVYGDSVSLACPSKPNDRSAAGGDADRQS